MFRRKQKRASSLCYARLPRAGLGNMLLVWARALVFAQLNGLSLVNSRWHHLHVGPLLRREKNQRFYFNYFNPSTSIGIVRRFLISRSYNQVVEPPLRPLPDLHHPMARNLYIFHAIPHWSDYFAGIKNHRSLVRRALYEMLAEKYRRDLAGLPSPIISVHVRRGDFRELKPGEDFAKVGLVRAPLQYFRGIIERIRELYGAPLPVTVFSDGYDHELGELLKMPGVTRSSDNAAIVDLLLMSRSRLIITSPGSTFSCWSAFLSDAPVLHHPAHVHTPSRPDEINQVYFEGGVDGECSSWPDLLLKNIRQIG